MEIFQGKYSQLASLGTVFGPKINPVYRLRKNEFAEMFTSDRCTIMQTTPAVVAMVKF